MAHDDDSAPILARDRVARPTVAVLGCGHWGKNLVRNFESMGVLACVCELSPTGRSVAASIAPFARIDGDADSVLHSDVDAVVIATPAATHYSLAMAALLAGKDVFVEKPLALTVAEGAQLVELAERLGRILMVGHVLEYHPAVVALRELVEHRELGEIRYIYSNRLSLGKVRREENIVWSFAPHDVAVLLRLMGTMPIEVITCGGSYLQTGIADMTVTHLRFENGVRAHIHVSWLHPFKEQRLVVVGEKKMASFDDVRKQLLLYDQRVDLNEGEPVPVRGDSQEVPFSGEEPLRTECEAFVLAVATRRAPLTDGASGLRVLEILEAAHRSLVRNGEAVPLPVQAFDADGMAAARARG